MTKIDDNRQRDRKQIGDIVDEKNCVNKRFYDPARSLNPTRSKSQPGTPSSSRNASTSTKWPPKLTEEERKLLQESDGCFKCRTLYAGHRADKCMVAITSENYQTLTAQDVLRAKNTRDKTTNKGPPLAAIMDRNVMEQVTVPLAAIFPAILNAETSFSNLSGSSMSSVSTSLLKCDHLLWHCIADDGLVQFPVKTTALIDSRAHMIFIRPDLVERLDLHAFRLSTPENISVAIDAKQPAPLTHYVCLTVSSHNGLFKSKALNAVIAPGLCMPIILGLPFLVNHKIVCDYANRECLVTLENRKYNLLTQPIQRHFSCDILAAIHDRIKDLTLEQELAHQEANMRMEFAQVFEPIPHVNKLPIQPWAHI